VIVVEEATAHEDGMPEGPHRLRLWLAPVHRRALPTPRACWLSLHSDPEAKLLTAAPERAITEQSGRSDIPTFRFLHRRA